MSNILLCLLVNILSRNDQKQIIFALFNSEFYVYVNVVCLLRAYLLNIAVHQTFRAYPTKLQSYKMLLSKKYYNPLVNYEVMTR